MSTLEAAKAEAERLYSKAITMEGAAILAREQEAFINGARWQAEQTEGRGARGVNKDAHKAVIEWMKNDPLWKTYYLALDKPLVIQLAYNYASYVASLPKAEAGERETPVDKTVPLGPNPGTPNKIKFSGKVKAEGPGEDMIPIGTLSYDDAGNETYTPATLPPKDQSLGESPQQKADRSRKSLIAATAKEDQPVEDVREEARKRIEQVIRFLTLAPNEENVNKAMEILEDWYNTLKADKP